MLNRFKLKGNKTFLRGSHKFILENKLTIYSIYSLSYFEKQINAVFKFIWEMKSGKYITFFSPLKMGPLFFLGGIWLVIILPLLTFISHSFAAWHHMTATGNQNPVVFQGSV